MKEEIQKLKEKIESELNEISTIARAEAFKLEYIVRKGKVAELFEKLKDVPNDMKREVGKSLNDLKLFAEGVYKEATEKYSTKISESSIDLTLPARKLYHGAEHPVMQTISEIENIFTRMGFEIAMGPDIEDDYHNFGALNFAEDHPARDMQDTFFVDHEGKDDILLRTHTSSVQIRFMEKHKPPIRAIMPGRVYRNEAISGRALAEFHQVEGLCIDKDVSMANLKGLLVDFAKAYYGDQTKFRFRTSYFPFTEPSMEMDIYWGLNNDKDYMITKGTGWLEILGCGMVHPSVLKNCNIDPDEYTGYAFGIGIERTVMLKTGIDDIRLFYENDLRVWEQLY